MEIKIGDKFIKEGEIVEVVNTEIFRYSNKGKTIVIKDLIVFTTISGYIRVLIKPEFLEQYNLYTPVYEWQFAWLDNNQIRYSKYKTDEEAELHLKKPYEKIELTKRPRNK